MRKNIGINLFIILVLGLTISGCGKAKAPEAPKTRAPREVRLVPAERGTLPRTVTVTGTLAADEEVTASFKVAGRISELAVDLGSPVRKNQVIARLDPTDFLLRIEQAEAALRQTRARLGLSPDGSDDQVDPEKTAPVREARAVLDESRQNRERAARLLEKNYISRMDLDSAQARLLVAESRYQASIEEVRDRQALLAQRKSELGLSRQQLADATLYAPLDGAVRERKVSAGEFLAAGSSVAVLVRTHPLRLKVAVPERDAAAIRSGQVTRVRVEGDPAEHTGRVVRISPVLEKQSRTLTVEAEVENMQGRLRAGSFATAEILIDAGQAVVLVPVSAIVTFAGIEKVIGEKQGTAVERRIRTGRRAGDKVEILEGLAPGDLIVAEPGNLSGGDPVSVKQ
ncbi:MAG: efflux RND transporter periplasmic adaptor subunit [Thermodesulfovibrionales bacterium]